MVILETVRLSEEGNGGIDIGLLCAFQKEGLHPRWLIMTPVMVTTRYIGLNSNLHEQEHLIMPTEKTGSHSTASKGGLAAG